MWSRSPLILASQDVQFLNIHEAHILNFPSGAQSTVFRSTLLILATLGLLSCASNEIQDGPDLGQVPGDLQKCAYLEEQSHPDCFCHDLAIARYPGRAESCEARLAHFEEVNTYRPGSCENPYVAIEALSSFAERKREFCRFNENWNRAACYCYEPVVTFMPERENFCSSLTAGELTKKLSPYPTRTSEWVTAFRENTYWTEFSVTEESEHWANNTVTYLNQELVIDDCDAVDSLLDLAFGIGGFELFELSKVLVDTNTNDDVLADHYVGAIWVSGGWRYIEIGSQRTEPLEFIELIGVEDSSGRTRPAKIVAYRRLDQSHWHQGSPPPMEEAYAFCPVHPDLLFPRTRSLI